MERRSLHLDELIRPPERRIRRRRLPPAGNRRRQAHGTAAIALCPPLRPRLRHADIGGALGYLGEAPEAWNARILEFTDHIRLRGDAVEGQWSLREHDIVGKPLL